MAKLKIISSIKRLSWPSTCKKLDVHFSFNVDSAAIVEPVQSPYLNKILMSFNLINQHQNRKNAF